MLILSFLGLAAQGIHAQRKEDRLVTGKKNLYTGDVRIVIDGIGTTLVCIYALFIHTVLITVSIF